MDKITKFLRRLSPKEQDQLATVIADIITGKVSGYDQKKMKGHANLYRIRVGDIRIVYIDLNTEQRILLIERRNDNTYRDF